MTEQDLNKIQFMKQLNLMEIAPENKSYEILDKNVRTTTSNQCSDLLAKNNSVKTGYENYCLQKGRTNLIPFVDFDFISKIVVCLKCWQKFDSKMLYIAHVGTDRCVRTYFDPKSEKRKFKNGRRERGKKKNKSIEDLIVHDKTKYLVNPEMLDTLQTRNNCYSDTEPKRRKVKEKRSLIRASKSDEPAVKKRRGKHRKETITLEHEVTVGIEPEKQDQPKKFVPVSVKRKTDNKFNNDFQSHENASNVQRTDSGSVDDAHDYNVNERARKTLFFSQIKILIENCRKIMNSTWIPGTHTVGGHRHFDEYCNRTRWGETIIVVPAHKITYILFTIDTLENDLKLILKHLNNESEYSQRREVESILSGLIEKRNEFKQSTRKTDTINEPTTGNKRIENIHCKIMENDVETERNMKQFDFHTAEHLENWSNNDTRDSGSSDEEIIVLSDDDESSVSTDSTSSENETSNDETF